MKELGWTGVTKVNRRRFPRSRERRRRRADARPGSRLRRSAVGTTPTSEIVVVGAGAFGGWTALYLRERALR